MIMEEWVWEKLLADIECRQVIPVIGPELLRVTVDGTDVALYHYVAEQLLARLELDREYLPPDYDFYHVVSEFLVQCKTHPKHYEADIIYYKIREILGETEWGVPESLRQLASIRQFDLFVSTTYDQLMERAINEEQGGGPDAVRSLAYRSHSQPEDLPDSWAQHPEPTVYHVFGVLNRMNDFAVTDEDILHYAHRLQSFDFRPQNLFDQFREKRLMTLGCSFPGWLTRFFLAAAKGEDLFTVGVPGLLADDRSPKIRDLVGFLERKRTNVYTQGDAVSFVGELHRRWIETFGKTAGSSGEEEEGTLQPVPQMEPDAVFISFRREDRDTARKVASRFRKAGLDTWFDETDLEPGDIYKQKIAKHIRNCFAFVPLISRFSISNDPKPWFYRFEWKKAIEAAEFRASTSQFILPLLVDDTDPADERIPEEFRKCQICRLGKIDAMVAAVRKRIRELRLGGGMQ